MLFATTLPDHVAKLRDIDLFADCTPRELRRIDSLVTGVRIERGRVLCRRGEIGRECFVLLDGQADVDVDDHHYVVGPGALLGEIALLVQGGRRTATVTHKILRAATRRLVQDVEAASRGGIAAPGKTT